MYAYTHIFTVLQEVSIFIYMNMYIHIYAIFIHTCMYIFVSILVDVCTYERTHRCLYTFVLCKYIFAFV